jgi:putative ABC transport system permease protein
METIAARTLADDRAMAAYLAVLIVLLLAIAALGVFGLASFNVGTRTRQIGTRRALGARRGDVLRHFLAENWLLTTMGVVVGIGLAYGLNVGLVTAVAGARLRWPLLAVGVLLLWSAGLLATLAPALRASRISPALATRNV